MNKKTILVLTALSTTLVGCVNAPKGLEKEQFTLKSYLQFNRVIIAVSANQFVWGEKY